MTRVPLVRVQVEADVRIEGVGFEAGAVVDLDPDRAARFVAIGVATYAPDAPRGRVGLPLALCTAPRVLA